MCPTSNHCAIYGLCINSEASQTTPGMSNCKSSTGILRGCGRLDKLLTFAGYEFTVMFTVSLNVTGYLLTCNI